MPGAETLLAFAAATLIFAYMPGPALLYAAAQTLARGRRGGLLASLGIHIGGYGHVVAASIGLSAILTHVPQAYMALKLAGAVYLIWLGVRMVLARPSMPARTGRGPQPDAAATVRRRGTGAGRAFVQSVLVELLNPKTALFFLAFLPQFVDPSAGLPVWAQFLILGTVVNLTFTSADLVAVFLTSMVLRRLGRTGLVERVARWIGGTILIGLGARLAASRA